MVSMLVVGAWPCNVFSPNLLTLRDSTVSHTAVCRTALVAYLVTVVCVPKQQLSAPEYQWLSQPAILTGDVLLSAKEDLGENALLSFVRSMVPACSQSLSA